MLGICTSLYPAVTPKVNKCQHGTPGGKKKKKPNLNSAD